MNGLGALESDGWAGSMGWQLGEESVAFTLPLAGVTQASGSAGHALVTYGKWSRQSEARDVWPDGVGLELQGAGVSKGSWEREGPIRDVRKTACPSW